MPTAEDVEFVVSGDALRGKLFRPDDAPQPPPVVILQGGLGGPAESNWGMAAAFTDAGHRYTTTEDVSVPPAHAMADGSWMAGAQDVWIQADEEGAAAVVEGSQQFQLEGLDPEQAEQLQGGRDRAPSEADRPLAVAPGEGLRHAAAILRADPPFADRRRGLAR